MTIIRHYFLSLALSILLLSCKPCHGRLKGIGENLGHFSEPPENTFDPMLVTYPKGSFTPLECNKNLYKEPCTTSFSSYFSAESGMGMSTLKQNRFDKKLTIPCGKCLVMDQYDDVLDILGGLDIQGKLLIPDGISLRIRVTSLLVQGELEMFSSKPIDGQPSIHFVWLDAKSPPSFSPENNTDICGGELHACGLGRKPFVVAGGKVNIRGLPDEDMPTWVPLYDVESSVSEWSINESQFLTYQALPANCPGDGVLIEGGIATTTSTPVFITSDGSKTELTDLSLNVHQHQRSKGSLLDLKNVQHCLEPGIVYLLSARVQLFKSGVSGYTECAETGKGCLTVVRKTTTSANEEIVSNLWREHQSYRTKLGQDFTITTEIRLDTDHIFPSALKDVLEFSIPDKMVEIKVHDLMLMTPPPEAFQIAETVCGNMVPANGDAELFQFSPFPFTTNHEAIKLEVAEEDSNRFFRVTGREFTDGSKIALDQGSIHLGDQGWNGAGMTWEIPHDCIKRQSTYRIHADVRVHGELPVELEFDIKGTIRDNRAIYEMLVKCPPSKGNWVSCDGEFTVSKKLENLSHRYDISIQLHGAVAANYDIDNLSFELIEGPIDRIILPASIKNTWAPGAQLMLTSHTNKWNTHQMVNIDRIQDDVESGYVNVKLRGSIFRPTTAKENPLYATEVALLSRNIMFDGTTGAHFTVLHTPNVPQVIQGADFVTFGNPGERDHYPILFDHCDDSSGSLVSKNSIRRSGQRCLVLHATNNVIVEGNVAHDNAGHCFALESGAEVGNMFMNNLGSFTRSSHALMPQYGISGKETDDTPATFWITNPLNSFEGNVAAGSNGHGFWMALSDRPRGPYGHEKQLVPSLLPLTYFSGNIAHSTMLYPLKISGYQAAKQESINGFRAYLGYGNDAFDLSSTKNVIIKNLITDKPVHESNKMWTKNATVVEMLECDNATAYLEYLEGELDPVSDGMAVPSASSVFYLQES